VLDIRPSQTIYTSYDEKVFKMMFISGVGDRVDVSNKVDNTGNCYAVVTRLQPESIGESTSEHESVATCRVYDVKQRRKNSTPLMLGLRRNHVGKALR
jgi:hypothetical protein